MAKVLIVDDEQMNIRLAEHLLTKNGYETVSATSGDECINILVKNPEDIDLVLLDISMEGMDGLETLNIIRSTPDICNTKVIFLTASTYRENVTEALRMGALDFIKKPFFPFNFLERVKKACAIERRDLILVVDDERMNHVYLKGLLDNLYEVKCVISGMEALTFIEEKRPDLVLLDLHMTGMDGLQTFEKIKEFCDAKNCVIPVIFLTGDTEEKTEVQIFNAGAMDYIKKPFIPEVLLQRMHRTMELVHLQKNMQTEVNKKTAELKASRMKIMNLSTQVMLALAGTIDAKDKSTSGHSMRVAKYSLEIARRMGKPQEMLDEMYFVALLHDIGKIGVPDEIINKVDRLTDAEYEIIRTHSAAGARILEQITEMPRLAEGAHWHHERIDGRGYPDGLKGDEIPEVARIIAVADAYDAMSSNRAYREAIPQKVIRNELINGSGTQFDAEAARIMVEIIDEDTEYTLREGGAPE
ncbi:MAG: response regulator [Oscillospiraceae bacterium]